MPDPLRARKNCPVKNAAPAQCNDCAIAIRVLDEKGIDDLRKKGVKEPEAYAWDCPLRLPALYLGEMVTAVNAVADMLAGLADAADAGKFVKGRQKERKKVEKKSEKSGLSTVGEGRED